MDILYMEGELEMIEPEIKEILDNHKETLEDQGCRIVKLEIDSEVMKERWGNITTQLTRIENSSLSSNNALLASNNSVLQTLNNVLDSNKTSSTNKTQVIIKVLGIVGGLIVGWFALKGVTITM